MPFTFFPVALYELCSRCLHRLRFLTFGLFLWCGFLNAEKFSSNTEFLWRGRLVLQPVSFANLKTAAIGQLSIFFFSPTCVLRVSSSLAVVPLASAY